MTQRAPITVRLESFEGPLDLLLYLIQSHEMEISKISISKITDQYLAYVQLMQELNFDVASDFLVMAATLVYWKSKALLPQEEGAQNGAGTDDGILSPEDLLRQLREHQRFLEMGRDLNSLSLLGDEVFTRPNSRPPTERVWKFTDVSSLALTYQDLLVRERKRKTILKKETVSLAGKIKQFSERLSVGNLVGMSALIDEIKSKPEIVVTFLASLELSRLKKLKLYQEGVYQEIYVELLESLKNFDPQLATGFDALQETVENGIKDAATAAASANTSNSNPDSITGNAGIDAGLTITSGTTLSPSSGELSGAHAGDNAHV